MLGAMAEGKGRLAVAQGGQHGAMGNAAQGQDRAEPGQGCDFLAQEGVAGADLYRRGFVFRRHAAHAVGDPAVQKLQAIVGTCLIDAAGKTRGQQGRIEQVAGAVAGEGPPRAVGPAHARRQADHQQAGVHRAEGLDRAVVPVGLAFPVGRPEGDKPRAQRAVAPGEGWLWGRHRRVTTASLDSP